MDQFNALTINHKWFLEELTKISGMLTKME